MFFDDEEWISTGRGGRMVFGEQHWKEAFLDARKGFSTHEA
jgi:hypothetical protein